MKNVTKRFGNTVAVDNVSLTVPKGAFFSLLGPSGCGKTTSLRMIAGFEATSGGDICLGGESVVAIPPHQRPVNTVFQNYALFPHMDVYENVAFGLRRKKVPNDEIQRRIGEALDMVTLSGYERRRISQLSGGQQQRVALARALVNRPAVLLLDEPMAALDPKLRKAMQTELKRLQRDVGITFILVTHDQEEALTMSDLIAVMSGGKVEQVGTPQEIYQTPQSRFVADFIGLANFLRGEVAATKDGCVTLRLSQGDSIQVQCDNAVVGTAMDLAIRPEMLSFGGDGGNALSGTVTDIVYLGSLSHYHIALSDGTRIVVSQPPGATCPGLNEPCIIHWSVQAGRLLTTT